MVQNIKIIFFKINVNLDQDKNATILSDLN